MKTIQINNEIQIMLKDLENMCEKYKDYSCSISIHRVPLEKIPEEYIVSDNFLDDGKIFKTAKANDEVNTLTVFIKD